MKRIVSLLSAFLALGIGMRPVRVSAQEIWFGMRGMQQWKGVDGYADWERLFLQSAEKWPSSLDRVRVIQVTTQTLRAISVEDLRKVRLRLSNEHIALSIEMLAQAYDETSSCGTKVEGYAQPAGTAAIAAKLKEAGATLQYAAMDEPLWFGHYYRGRNACQSSIEDVAVRVARNITEYAKVFPDIQVGDVEPVPALTDVPGWEEDYTTWRQRFRSATGRNLAFIHADVNWPRSGWQNGLRSLAQYARRTKLPFGIIYNAGPQASSDSEWLAGAEAHIREVEDRLQIVPDSAIFQSWTRFPLRGVGDQSLAGYDDVVKHYGERVRPR